MKLTWRLCILLVCTGCGPPSRSGNTGVVSDLSDALDAVGMDPALDLVDIPEPSMVLWAEFAPTPPVRGALFETHPALADFFLMRFHQPPESPRPDASHLGDFGIGNGRVFALEGLTFPLNTLHGMVGPTYSRRDRFYGDLALFLGDADAVPLEFEEEWIATPRAIPALVSAGRVGDMLVVVVDVAPWPHPNQAVRPVHTAVWRRIAVSNEGEAESDPMTLVVATTLKQRIEDDALVESRSDGVRAVFFRGHGAMATDDRHLVLPVPPVPAKGVFETDLIVATAPLGAQVLELRAALAAEDLVTLIQETASGYHAFEATLTRVETPDPVVNDLFRVLSRTLWVQVSAQGASSPLSRYTKTWTRDLSGVVRPLALLGAHDLARRILAYYYAVASEVGGIRNAYEADLELDLEHPAPVDWDSLPPMTGLTAAEGPSHLPLMFGWLWEATGDTTWIAQHVRFLRHTLFKQQWNELFLQPFSGDETFRAAMNIAFGLPIEYPHEVESWSLVSSVLLAAGAEALARMETALGNGPEAEAARGLSLRSLEAALTLYRIEDGCLAGLIHRKDSALSPPFEDAVLMGPWSGPPWSGSDAAVEAIECLARRLQVAPGVFRSPLHPMYQGFAGLPIQEGVYTGMLPGYTLRVLAQEGHPDAEAAFNHIRRVLSPSGNVAEYHVSDDESALQFVYDGLGQAGDVTARFRPWEGGIILDAIFFYLTGFEPDAPSGRARLRPHLPNGWPEMAVAPLRIGNTIWSLRVARTPQGFAIGVSHESGPDAVLSLTFDAPNATRPVVSLNGRILEDSECVFETRFGHTVVALPQCEPRPGQPCFAVFEMP